MAVKKNKSKNAEFNPDAFRLGVNFAIKSMNDQPMGGEGETEEVITIEGCANFSGNVVSESSTFIDRVGDVVVPDGIDVTNYKKSPIILFQHDRTQVIGKAIDITKKSDGLYVTAEIHAGACDDEVFYAIKNGLYTSFSIGFRTRKAEWKTIGDTEVFFITQSELLETSIVSIPCNTDSTFSVVKSFDGNIYSNDVDYAALSQEDSKNKSLNVDGDEYMKVKLRDTLSADMVKAMEEKGLTKMLDEAVEVDTKTFIEDLVASTVTAEVAKAIEAYKQSLVPVEEEKTQEQIEAEEKALADAQALAAQEEEAAAVEAKLQSEATAFKSLSDEIANLKALVIEEK